MDDATKERISSRITGELRAIEWALLVWGCETLAEAIETWWSERPYKPCSACRKRWIPHRLSWCDWCEPSCLALASISDDVAENWNPDQMDLPF